MRVALKHNPDNEEAKHALSALVADPTVTTASTAYITSLFDEYAATFDKALVQDLNYTAPQKIHEVVSELAARSGIKSFKTVVDVGCGTGLVGPLVRNLTETLVGVDLSSQMIEQARQRQVYDELHVEEITESLGRYHNKSDRARMRAIGLVVAADVFVYSGDLGGVFKAAALGIKRGGWFALTLERLFRNETAEAEAEAAGVGAGESVLDISGEEAAAGGEVDAPKAQTFKVTEEDLAKGWKLQLSGRFAHSEQYVTGLATANGFKVMHHETFVPRKDQGKDIPGQLFVLELTR